MKDLKGSGEGRFMCNPQSKKQTTKRIRVNFNCLNGYTQSEMTKRKQVNNNHNSNKNLSKFLEFPLTLTQLLFFE